MKNLFLMRVRLYDETENTKNQKLSVKDGLLKLPLCAFGYPRTSNALVGLSGGWEKHRLVQAFGYDQWSGEDNT